tara:strand:+ start:39469 stop:40164 length:696 start_codon:yes stop_codon:yes gene_type:complete
MHKHKINRTYYEDTHEDNNQENDSNHIEIHDVQSEQIFSTPIWSMEIDTDNDAILEECYDLERKFPNGVRKSNAGGWQSDVFEIETISPFMTPKIQILARNVEDITYDLVEEFAGGKKNLSANVGKDQIGWWININRGYSYNVYHTHPGCALIALYYAKIPNNKDEREGNLVLLRQDSMNHNNVFANIGELCEANIIPQEKHLYIMPSVVAHYVTAHTCNEDRISIAFNIG